MEYYSVIKKNEILPFSTTCVDLKGTTLSEISQRKTKAIWSNSYVEFKNKKQNQKKKNSKLTDTENRLIVVRGGVKGIKKVQTSSYKINKSWEWNVQLGD